MFSCILRGQTYNPRLLIKAILKSSNYLIYKIKKGLLLEAPFIIFYYFCAKIFAKKRLFPFIFYQFMPKPLQRLLTQNFL